MASIVQFAQRKTSIWGSILASLRSNHGSRNNPRESSGRHLRHLPRYKRRVGSARNPPSSGGRDHLALAAIVPLSLGRPCHGSPANHSFPAGPVVLDLCRLVWWAL